MLDSNSLPSRWNQDSKIGIYQLLGKKFHFCPTSSIFGFFLNIHDENLVGMVAKIIGYFPKDAVKGVV